RALDSRKPERARAEGLERGHAGRAQANWDTMAWSISLATDAVWNCPRPAVSSGTTATLVATSRALQARASPSASGLGADTSTLARCARGGSAATMSILRRSLLSAAGNGYPK